MAGALGARQAGRLADRGLGQGVTGIGDQGNPGMFSAKGVAPMARREQPQPPIGSCQSRGRQASSRVLFDAAAWTVTDMAAEEGLGYDLLALRSHLELCRAAAW